MQNYIITWISRLIVAILVLPIHECAHAYVAYRLGDSTARDQGRITLNPMAHLDLMGTIFLVFFGYGWAKPVQVNPNSFKNPRKGMGIVALAGPVSNIILGFILILASKLLMRAAVTSQILYFMAIALYSMASTSIYLAFFNLIPVPPLDGSKVLGMVLSDRAYSKFQSIGYILPNIVMMLAFVGVFRYPLSWLTNMTMTLLGKLLFFI